MPCSIVLMESGWCASGILGGDNMTSLICWFRGHEWILETHQRALRCICMRCLAVTSGWVLPTLDPDGGVTTATKGSKHND
jgi:hypothetical protein